VKEGPSKPPSPLPTDVVPGQGNGRPLILRGRKENGNRVPRKGILKPERSRTWKGTNSVVCNPCWKKKNADFHTAPAQKNTKRAPAKSGKRFCRSSTRKKKAKFRRSEKKNACPLRGNKKGMNHPRENKKKKKGKKEELSFFPSVPPIKRGGNEKMINGRKKRGGGASHPCHFNETFVKK